MTLLAEQASVNDQSLRELLQRAWREHRPAREPGLALGSGLFNSLELRLRIDQPARLLDRSPGHILVYPSPPSLEECEIPLGSVASASERHRTLLVWQDLHRSGEHEGVVLAPIQPSRIDIITPAAEKRAKSLGLYGVFILTIEIVHEIIPSLTALLIDVKEDPEDEGYITICFTITIHDSVEQVMRLDDTLQATLYERLPTQTLPHFSFGYRFE